MQWLYILIVLALGLYVVELFKHKLTRKLVHVAFLAVIVIIGLMLVSAYIDIGSIFSQDSTIATTGAAITEGIGEDIKDVNLKESSLLKTIEDKSKEFISSMLDKLINT